MFRKIVFCLVIFAVIDCIYTSPPLLGGASELRDITPEIREITEKVRPKFEKDMPKKVAEFTPVKYRSQTVAGTNYFIKVRVAPNEFVHLRVHRPITGKDVILHGVLKNKKDSDPLEIFPGDLNLP